MDFHQQLTAWKRAESAAVDAELAVQRMGQAAADPRVPELLLRARQLRDTADAMLAAIVLELRQREGPEGSSGPGQS